MLPPTSPGNPCFQNVCKIDKYQPQLSETKCQWLYCFPFSLFSSMLYGVSTEKCWVQSKLLVWTSVSEEIVHFEMMGNWPESTACKPSMIIERHISGASSATKSTTLFSLLKAYPKMWRQKKRIRLTVTTSTRDMINTTWTATCAAWGFPAPNSFETRVLPVRCIVVMHVDYLLTFTSLN